MLARIQVNLTFFFYLVIHVKVQTIESTDLDTSKTIGSVYDYGCFQGGSHQPLMAMVEITGQCNMACPVCFAGSNAASPHITLNKVKTRIDKLLEIAGPVPLQISGGEPTLHPELPQIIDYAREKKFKNIELVTNGIRISQDRDYLMALTTKGLTAVYLQFDGLSKETYIKIRGQDMKEVRLKSIAAIRSAKICCTLAVAVTRNINDHELGDVIRFSINNIDTVRAINFQSAARFAGRFDVDSPGMGFTLPELIGLIEEQAGLEDGGFLTNILGDHNCNALSLLYAIDDRPEPLFRYLSQKNIERFLGANRRQTILDLFLGKESFTRKHLFRPTTWKLLAEAVPIFGKHPNLKSILAANHLLIFAKSFMEKDFVDCKRVDNCVYGLATENNVYSFCAYNNFHRFPKYNQQS